MTAKSFRLIRIFSVCSCTASIVQIPQNAWRIVDDSRRLVYSIITAVVRLNRSVCSVLLPIFMAI